MKISYNRVKQGFELEQVFKSNRVLKLDLVDLF